MSVHTCNLHCHTIDPDKLDLMGMEDDPGKWMPFAFHMDIVVGVKLTSEDEDSILYQCTTIFTENGDAYIIDTKYVEFLQLFVSYHKTSPSVDEGDINF